MARHNPCPRCGGQLIGWDGPDTSCLQCGYIAYRRTPLLGQGRLDLGVDFDDKAAPHLPDRARQGRDDSE
jgi:hypothetical protein